MAASGCEPANPSSPSPPPLASACIGLQAAQCEQALEALADNPFGDRTAIYVAVAVRFCDGPCPGAERGAWLGHLTVEFADAQTPATILIEVDGATVGWESIETALVLAMPRSARLAAPTTEMMLGHCGLASGIDIDGTFWNPTGIIDLAQQDLINSAEASFSLTSPTTATLRTVGGAVVQLARHPGPKYLVPCD